MISGYPPISLLTSPLPSPHLTSPRQCCFWAFANSGPVLLLQVEHALCHTSLRSFLTILSKKMLIFLPCPLSNPFFTELITILHWISISLIPVPSIRTLLSMAELIYCIQFYFPEKLKIQGHHTYWIQIQLINI